MNDFFTDVGIQQAVLLVNENLARLETLAEEQEALGIGIGEEYQSAPIHLKRQDAQIEDQKHRLSVETGKILLAASEMLEDEQLDAFQQALHYPNGVPVGNFEWASFCEYGSGLVDKGLAVLNQILNQEDDEEYRHR